MGTKQQLTIFTGKPVNSAFFIDAKFIDMYGFCLHIKHLQGEGSFAHNREDIVLLYSC